MAFFRDTFTEASDVDLTAHTSDSSHTWSTAEGAMTVSGSLDSVYTSGTANAYSYASALPTSPDYEVRATFRFITNLSGSTQGITLRGTASQTKTLYLGRYAASSSQWVIYKFISNVATLIASGGSFPFAAGDYDVVFKAEGSTISLYVDDVLQCSVTNTEITTAGRVGLRFTIPAASATTGIHILGIEASYLDTGGPKLAFLSDGSFVSETGTGISFTSGGQLVSETIETGSTIPESAAPVSGHGTVSAAGQKVAQGAAPVSGTGSVTAAGQKVSAIPESAAPVSGHGVVSAAVSKVGQGPASVSGHGTVSAAGSKIGQRAAPLSGHGVVSAAVSKIGQRAAPLSGHGVVSAAGEEVSTIPTGSAPIADTGTISAAGRKIAQGSAPIADTGTIISSGQKNAQGSATLSGHGIVTATGINVDDIIVPPVEPEQPQAQLLPPDVSYWSKSVTKESNRRQQEIYQQLRAARRQRR